MTDWNKTTTHQPTGGPELLCAAGTFVPTMNSKEEEEGEEEEKEEKEEEEEKEEGRKGRRK